MPWGNGQTSQKWAFSEKTHRPCHYFLPHLLFFFPSVCRAMHLCPAATASSTSFWEAFENTSVSSFQKLFSVWEYLWIPFDIITYIVVVSAPAHTCGLTVSLCLFLPDPHLKQCRWIYVFCDGLKSYESDVSAWEKAALGKASLFFDDHCRVTAWTEQINPSLHIHTSPAVWLVTSHH